jgi:riboflavin synthase
MMFTGIITHQGQLLRKEGARLEIATQLPLAPIPLGASIACDGVCLTVIEKTSQSFVAEVSAETFARTTLQQWQEGRYINLERPIQAGGEFGGHFVTGHVDGVGKVASFTPQEGFFLLGITFPPALRYGFAAKGSVAVNGVSLTVNAVTDSQLEITLIPHTAAHTNLGALQQGDAVNLEIDLIARYIAPYLARFS